MKISSYLSKLRISKKMVFDPVRRKWLIIQPEELVRQALLLYLIEEKKLPRKRIAVEKRIQVHGQIRRFDVVYFNRQGHPLLLVECKSPSTILTDLVLEQAARYNFEIKAPYLLLTNGIESSWYKIDPLKKTYTSLHNEGPDLMK